MKKQLTLLALILFQWSLPAQEKLIVGPGGVLTSSNHTHINMHNTSLINNGLVNTEESFFVFDGDQLLRIDGTGNSEVHGIKVNLEEKIQLRQDLTVNFGLVLENGLVDLMSSRLHLRTDAAQVYGETADQYIYASGNGFIVKDFDFSQPQGFDPGNLGLEITSLENLGEAQLIRAHDILVMDGVQSIRRNYELITEQTKTQEARLKAYYREHELVGALNDPGLWRITPEGSASIYTFNKGSSGDRGSFVEANVSGPFAIFTVADAVAAYDMSDTPTAFTPNGDGKNDVFVIPFIEETPGANVMIFNRWGEKIYESNDYTLNPWDGTWKGKVLDPNTFYYRIKVLGIKKSFDGKVSILR